MKKNLLFLMLALAPLSIAAANEQYELLVDRLTAVTEGPAVELAKQGYRNLALDLATELVENNVNFPAEAKQLLAKEIENFLFRETFENEEMKRIKYEIYSEHFNLLELKELVAFYDTDIGKKVITELPQIVKKAQARSTQGAEAILDSLHANIETIVHKLVLANDW